MYPKFTSPRVHTPQEQKRLLRSWDGNIQPRYFSGNICAGDILGADSTC